MKGALNGLIASPDETCTFEDSRTVWEGIETIPVGYQVVRKRLLETGSNGLRAPLHRQRAAC